MSEQNYPLSSTVQIADQIFFIFTMTLQLSGIQACIWHTIKHIWCLLVGESCIMKFLNAILRRLLTTKSFRKLQEITVNTVQLHFEIELRYGFSFNDDLSVPVLAICCTHMDTWAGSLQSNVHLNQHPSMCFIAFLWLFPKLSSTHLRMK